MHKKITNIFSILAAAALIAVLFSACSSTTTDFSALLKTPSDYNGKVVTVDAFYFENSNISILAGALTNPPSSKDMVPAPPNIWLSGALPQSVQSQLHPQTATPSGDIEHYAKIRVTGTFQYGGTYGYSNGYTSQIVISSAVYIS